VSWDPYAERSDAVEGTTWRPPEYAPIALGYGQPTPIREFFFDQVHGYYYSTGPVVAIKRHVAPA
jgi:hypothetical protein